MKIEQKYIDRFWTKVDKTSSCWIWAAGKTPMGYGMFNINGKNRAAHRVSVILDNRDPRGFVVMHKCDNPSCVRPDHLIVATQKDNMMDMSRKGRCHTNHAKGINAGHNKLTEEQVHEIRRSHKLGQSQKSLAEQYKLNGTTVFDIVHRNIWKHI